MYMSQKDVGIVTGWKSLAEQKFILKEGFQSWYQETEISKLIKAFPKDIAALDKRSVLAKVNSQGSGRQKPSSELERYLETSYV